MKIPCEKQLEKDKNRMCGAAALSMVYRSLGLTPKDNSESFQKEIWSDTKSEDGRGNYFSLNYKLCKNALDRGLNSLIIKAKNPFKVLDICSKQSIRCILSHRYNHYGPDGHNTVLVEKGVFTIVCDPDTGKIRKFTRPELETLWIPAHPEVVGNILIAIDNKIVESKCEICGTQIPSKFNCINCGKEILLQPSQVLGCIQSGCENRIWETIFCPNCDTKNEKP